MRIARRIGALALLAAVALAPLLSGAEPLRDDLFAAAFPTPEKGWACGRWGTVAHTEDGGVSWTRQHTGTDFTLAAISFPDERNGWAVGDEGTIVHTTDGGATWQKQPSPVPYFLMGVTFADRDHGWVVTERTTILATRDGGRTWTVQFSDQDFILKAVSFSDAEHGWAVGEFGFIYHTADGGETWEHQAGEFGFSEETGEMVGGSYLFDVAAVSPTEAWVVGIDGYAARTTDGGATWVRSEGLPKTHLFGVTVGAREVVVVGQAALLRSVDSGVTWESIEAEPAITYGWLYGVEPRGPGFVAVGKEGSVYRGSETGAWQGAGDRR